ncbi:acyltransferase family protein [Ornithinimicrobium sufpigmenti]|uniref:acyltransferase family protein n=1 Tax=Ornithinimicrobium sufpigmenti TaxID=2508882 RepID=UPI00103658D1|nr:MULTISPECIES: acyltransferase family protein [unclassified Ornithinimicrobium]
MVAPSARREGLHGLRGVAVILVVLFHLFGAGRVSGGIDVFLAISGFLFTGLILRRVTGEGLDLSAYLARLVRRLLPPILPVLAVVVLASLVLLPAPMRAQTWQETAAVLLYVENWQLISSQLGYDAAGVQTSPLQHFWSLSVQGQFYLFWPVVLTAAWWLLRRLRLPARPALAVVVLAVTAASFGYAVHLHRLDQQVAYLHTGARLWELTLPGLLALSAGHRRLPRAARAGLGWAGLALIVSCGFVLDGAALFPGPWALWPVLGVVLFLLADDTGAPGSADRLLTARPARWLGDISYALYLWHWPLLIIALHLSPRPAGDPMLSAVVLAVSVGLAHATHRLLERPLGDLRRWPSPLRTARAGAVVLVVPALVLGGSGLVLDSRARQEAEDARASLAQQVLNGTSRDHPGALALRPDRGPVPEAPLLLDPTEADADLPPHDAQGCWQAAEDRPELAEVLLCPEPPGTEVPDPVATVVITGGSHGAMWEPAWRVLAAEHGWRVLVMVKAGCQLTTSTGQFPVETDLVPNASCQEWNRRALTELVELDPDVVFTLGTTTAQAETTGEKASRGFVEVFEHLAEHDIDVVAIRDIFRMQSDVPACVAENLADPSVCDTPRVPGPSPLTPDMVPDNVGLVDLTDHVCAPEVCQAVVGNIIAYHDHSHLSASFATTLAPALDAALREAAPALYAQTG